MIAFYLSTDGQQATCNPTLEAHEALFRQGYRRVSFWRWLYWCLFKEWTTK